MASHKRRSSSSSATRFTRGVRVEARNAWNRLPTLRSPITSQAGIGGSAEPDLPAEFTKEHFARGVVGMARAQNPDSANSQFFIMFAPGDSLNGQYTVVGTVESGMELVDKIKKGDENNNGSVADPDKMISVKLASGN